MQIIYFKSHQQHPVDPEDVQHILQANEGVLWIDVNISSEQDMAFLTRHFSPHPLTLDNLQQHQYRPKAEAFTDYLFVTLNAINTLSLDAMFRKLGVYLGKNYVVTAHLGEEPLVGDIRQRLQPGRGVVVTFQG
jgi:magnesium transporter